MYSGGADRSLQRRRGGQATFAGRSMGQGGVRLQAPSSMAWVGRCSVCAPRCGRGQWLEVWGGSRGCAPPTPRVKEMPQPTPIVQAAHSVAGVERQPFDLSLELLRRRTSIKWREAPSDVLPLWVAEMDVMLADPVARALQDAVVLGDTGYPTGTEYAEAVRDFAIERWGWSGIDISLTALVPDVMMGIVEVLRLVTRPGSAVVVTPPVYPPFYSFVEHMDRRIVAAPLSHEGRIDVSTVEEACSEAAAGGPAALLLANPHNPTGAVHTADELAQVAAAAGRFGVRVVADEVHAPLVLPGARFTPYLSVPGTGDAFSVTSASKAWNLAGLKAAVVVAGDAAAADLALMPEEVSHGPSHLGVIAHTAAFRYGGEWLDGVLAGLDDNRSLLDKLIREHLPSVSWIPSEGTYLAWLDCRSLGLGTAGGAAEARGNVRANVGPAAAFLERGRVLVSSGPAFGSGCEGFVRLNFATSPQILTEALRRMGAVAAMTKAEGPRRLPSDPIPGP
jgi:cystathionine beta-lyase